jgi:hypothetical protein
MKPSGALKVYCACVFVLGLVLSLPLAAWTGTAVLEPAAALAVTLCWNFVFLLLLPVILDWSESAYFRARFLELEECARQNPHLAEVLSEQCRKLKLAGLRLAALDVRCSEPFSYGLFDQNPRLFVPASWLEPENQMRACPSIEVELSRFARRDMTAIFVGFALVQLLVQQVLMAVLF